MQEITAICSHQVDDASTKEHVAYVTFPTLLIGFLSCWSVGNLWPILGALDNSLA